VTGLLIVGIVVVALALYAVDRAFKARAQTRRLRNMSDRLVAATERAQKQEQRRQASAESGAALTSVIHAIERPPLSLPGMTSPGSASGGGTPDDAASRAGTPDDAAAPPGTPQGADRSRGGGEDTGPQEHRPAHPGRRPFHLGKRADTVRIGPGAEDTGGKDHTRPMPASADDD
jgi:hypothetical protein